MESLANNHAFVDGNKRVSFVMTDTMLRANGYFLDIEPLEDHKLITGAMEKNGFRFTMIRDWIVSIAKPLAAEENRARKKK
jgi:death-on-curing protein